MNTDRIEKRTTLKAPLDRAWRAVSDSREFGRWFGVSFDGPFEAGRTLTGRIKPTEVDAEVAKLQKPHEGTEFPIVVEAVEPMRRLVFRWHPGAEPGYDSSKEPMTRVAFELDAAGKDTHLTITESGFDALPAARRAEALKENEGGWDHQARLVAKYLELQRAA